LEHQADHVFASLLDNGIPITRKNYFDVAWIDGDWRRGLLTRGNLLSVMTRMEFRVAREILCWN
jgi:hypothetical protein